MTEIIFPHVLKLFINGFLIRFEMKHIKIECIGLIPDRGQSTRQGGTVVGWAAHVGGWAARSQARLGPTLASTILGPLLPEFSNFHDRISFCCCSVSPPHLFSCIPLCTTCGDKHISERNSKHIRFH